MIDCSLSLIYNLIIFYIGSTRHEDKLICLKTKVEWSTKVIVINCLLYNYSENSFSSAA